MIPDLTLFRNGFSILVGHLHPFNSSGIVGLVMLISVDDESAWRLDS